MTWQIYVLVTVIFLTGAAYGVLSSVAVKRYLRKRDDGASSAASSHDGADLMNAFTASRRSPMPWHWIKGTYNLRLPTKEECERDSHKESHDRLHTICSKLYGL